MLRDGVRKTGRDGLHARVRRLMARAIWAAPAVIMAAFFFKFFVVADNAYWLEKYTELSVPALGYPGGDARNIQLTAFCNSQVQAQATQDFATCYAQAKTVAQLYPAATVPPYNYPAIWAAAYGAFGDFSEEFFLGFWRLNAGALAIAVLFLALRTTPALFPLAAFSPAMLLAVERGNIDALTFAILYVPVLISARSGFVIGLSLFGAAVAKIFPIFALLAFLAQPFAPLRRGVMVAGLLALPVLVLTFVETAAMVDNTTKGFFVAFGLMSIHQAPFFASHAVSANLALGFYFLLAIGFVYVAQKSNLYANLETEIRKGDLQRAYLFYSSILIFGLTFLLFVNWSYRLIFLFPALFVLSTWASTAARMLLGVMGAILWLPIIPYGWGIQNVLCGVLFILLLPLYLGLLRPALLGLLPPPRQEAPASQGGMPGAFSRVDPKRE